MWWYLMVRLLFFFLFVFGGGFSILRNLFWILVLCAVPAADQQESVETEKVLSASPMMQVEGFFMALTNSNTDGRVVVHKQGAVLNTQHKIKNSYDINALQCKVHPLLVLQGLCRRAASSSFCWIRQSTLPRCWRSAEQSSLQEELCNLWVVLNPLKINWALAAYLLSFHSKGCYM